MKTRRTPCTRTMNAGEILKGSIKAKGRKGKGKTLRGLDNG
jgi:hypothetical protein